MIDIDYFPFGTNSPLHQPSFKDTLGRKIIERMDETEEQELKLQYDLWILAETEEERNVHVENMCKIHEKYSKMFRDRTIELRRLMC